MVLRTSHTKGFTLIEMLLYVSISSFFLLSLTAFFPFLISARVKNQTINEVNHGGIQAMQMMTQAIRNTKSISTPPQGTSSSSLSMITIDGALSPTLFDVASGTLRIKEGVGTYIALTNTKVTVSSLLFKNTSASSTDGGSVDVSFTISRSNAGVGSEYTYSKTFSGSVSFH